MTTAVCPLCHSDVIVDDEAYEHDLVTCANCMTDLEITSLTPLTLAALSEDESPA
jgi:transcription initiation factor TFIIIB Brf1 subunit/transcription initiation factor TFIIB